MENALAYGKQSYICIFFIFFSIRPSHFSSSDPVQVVYELGKESKFMTPMIGIHQLIQAKELMDHIMVESLLKR